MIDISCPVLLGSIRTSLDLPGTLSQAYQIGSRALFICKVLMGLDVTLGVDALRNNSRSSCARICAGASFRKYGMIASFEVVHVAVGIVGQ